ncbi:restriction endonuclease subunit S [Priestia megaterium]|uniref:restriction endonuclease subunit S n=1 Tax=Priestia megaterium TaxID=1404 RepID=UPI003D2B266D
MKLAPQLRFLNFHNNWDIKILSELGEFKKNYSFSRSLEGDGEYHHLHYGDIHSRYSGVLGSQTSFPSITVLGPLEVIEDRDLIFADASEDYKDLGKAVVIWGLENQKVVAGLHTHRFKPKENVDSRFLMYFTKTKKYKLFIRKQGTGISVLGISKKNLSFLEIPMPSFEEQQKIASFFSLMDKKIEKQKEKIKQLELLKKGMMQKIFSREFQFKDNNKNPFPKWNKRSLNKIAVINPKSDPLADEFYYIDLEAVEKGRLRKLNIVFKEKAPSRAQRVLKKNDVLFQTVRPYQQNHFYVSKLYDKQAVASTGYAQLRTNQCSKYLYHLMNTKKFDQEVLKRCTGTSYPAINSSDLGKIIIPIPSLEEQKKIASLLTTIDNKIEKEREILLLYNEQKKGFIERMFL